MCREEEEEEEEETVGPNPTDVILSLSFHLGRVRFTADICREN